MYLISYSQRVCLYRLRKRPTPGESRINEVMYHFIFVGPLFYSIGSLCFTNLYGSFKHGIIPNSLSIIISIFVLLAPYEEIIRFFIRKDKQIRSSNYFEDRIFFTA